MEVNAYLSSYFLEEKDKIQFLGNNMCSCIVTLNVFCVSCVANYIQRTLKDQTMCQEALFFFFVLQGVHGTQDSQVSLNGTHR